MAGASTMTGTRMPRFTIKRLMIVIAGVGLALGILRLDPSLAFTATYGLALMAGAWGLARVRPNLATRAFVPSAVWLNLSLFVAFVYLPLFHKSLLMLTWIVMIPTVPVLGLTWVASKEGRAARIRAALVVAAVIGLAGSILMTQWPLRLAFYLSSPALNRLADRIEAGGALTSPEWAGVYRIDRVQPFNSIGNGDDLMLRVNPTRGQMAGFVRRSGLPPGAGRESLTYGPEWGDRWNYRDSW